MDRCDSCKNIFRCAICGASSESFHHVGVRGTKNRFRIPVVDYNVTYDNQPSGIWHYSQSCNHRVHPAATSSIVKYNGGPPRRDRYNRQKIFWGGPHTKTSSSPLVERAEQAGAHLENHPSDSRGLNQPNA